jgi:hypothetical protein
MSLVTPVYERFCASGPTSNSSGHSSWPSKIETVRYSETSANYQTERQIRGSWGGGKRDYIVGKSRTISLVLKVPMQCPLVLLVGVKHIIRIYSKFNFGVRGAAKLKLNSMV